jgi:hypothetical protein
VRDAGQIFGIELTESRPFPNRPDSQKIKRKRRRNSLSSPHFDKEREEKAKKDYQPVRTFQAERSCGITGR